MRARYNRYPGPLIFAIWEEPRPVGDSADQSGDSENGKSSQSSRSDAWRDCRCCQPRIYAGRVGATRAAAGRDHASLQRKPLWSQPRCPESCSGSCCPGRLLPGGDRDRSSQSDCPPERAQTRKHGPFIRIERGPAGSTRGLGQERQNSASRTDLFRSSGLRAAHGCRIGAGTTQERYVDRPRDDCGGRGRFDQPRLHLQPE